jgi:AraC-like DNA-binding protein
LSDSHLIPNVFIRRQLGTFVFDQAKALSLLASHNIPAAVLTSDGYTESKKLAALANTVWRLLDDESTGAANKKLFFGSFKMLCRACSDCKNLKSVIHRSCEFFRLLSDEFHFQLEVKGQEAILILDHRVDDGRNNDYFMVCLSIVLTRWFAWMIDEAIKLERIEFQFPLFASIDDFEAIFYSAVEFNQTTNRIVFSSDFLNKPVVTTQDKLPAFLINAPHCFLSHYRPNNSTAEQVRKILKHSDEFAHIKLSDIAEQLHCSTATLTRRLKAENTTFMEIKDRIRKVKALSLLRTTDVPLTAISYLLGFSEASAFTRAFKKWTGESPVEYRNGVKK